MMFCCDLGRGSLAAKHFLMKGIGELQFVQRGVADALSGHLGGDEVTVRLGIVELYEAACIQIDHRACPRDSLTKSLSGSPAGAAPQMARARARKSGVAGDAGLTFSTGEADAAAGLVDHRASAAGSLALRSTTVTLHP